MKRVETSAARANLRELLDHVAESGEPVVITRRERDVAVVLPIEVLAELETLRAAKKS